MTSTSELSPILPLKIPGLPWFYVCYGSREGQGAEGGYVVQTFSDLYKLLTDETDDKPEPVVYLCSKEKGGRMTFRRVLALRPVQYTNTHAFELEDGHAVLWVEGKAGARVCIEVGATVSLVD